MDLDNEKQILKDEFDKQSSQHLKNKLELDKDAKSEEVRGQRYIDEGEEFDKLIDKKKAEVEDLKNKIAE